jgi:hypothetical protein
MSGGESRLAKRAAEFHNDFWPPSPKRAGETTGRAVVERRQFERPFSGSGAFNAIGFPGLRLGLME